MIKVLFLIHDLGHGGAERVLVNLVNNMDKAKFDITVISLFGGGVNEQNLDRDVQYKVIFKKSFPGNSRIMMLFTPQLLHKLFIKDTYDIEISFLEGPCTRIISGCSNSLTKLISWTHCTIHNEEELINSYRSKKEFEKCISRYDMNVFVSNGVRDSFITYLEKPISKTVLYNTNDTRKIKKLSTELTCNEFNQNEINLISTGRLIEVKAFDRLIRITKRLVDHGVNVHTYILGDGPLKRNLEEYIHDLSIDHKVTLLGYQNNPYNYVNKADLFICCSLSEGFSTAATEALIVGTPVCTVEVSGMKELLGDNNDYGLVVDNNEESLYQGIKNLLDNQSLLQFYREKAIEHGKMFSTENTVKAVEDMIEQLAERR